MIDVMIIEDREDYLIDLTPAAVIAAKEIMSLEEVKKAGIRVAIRGGGCAGFQFILDFSDEKDNDYIMNFDGLKIMIDPVSAVHLDGTTIDYVTGLSGSGFKFNNPHATHTCGCGSSFS